MDEQDVEYTAWALSIPIGQWLAPEPVDLPETTEEEDGEW